MDVSQIPAFVSAGATVFAATVAAGVAITLGLSQLEIAKAQREIAKRQKDIAEDKLRLDLFDRRLEIYNNIRDVSAELLNFAGDRSVSAKILALRPSLQSAEFLFPESVTGHVHALLSDCLKLQALENRAGRPGLPNEVRESAIEESLIQLTKIQEKIGQTEKVFRPFLSFGHVVQRTF